MDSNYWKIYMQRLDPKYSFVKFSIEPNLLTENSFTDIKNVFFKINIIVEQIHNIHSVSKKYGICSNFHKNVKKK